MQLFKSPLLRNKYDLVLRVYFIKVISLMPGNLRRIILLSYLSPAYHILQIFKIP